MEIVYHLGAHCTDEERLLRCLLKNRGALSAQGIVVPGPARYRNLLRDPVDDADPKVEVVNPRDFVPAEENALPY